MMAPNTRRARLSPDALSRQAAKRTRHFQIGPKIRIGGSVGAIGQKVKETVGKVASAAAPVVSFINPMLGAGLAAGGHVLDTTNGGTSVGDLLKSGVGAYATGKIGSALVNKIPGVSSISDRAKSLLGSIPGFGGGSQPADVFTDDPNQGQDQGLLQNIKNEAGRVVGRLANGQSPISVNGGDPLAQGDRTGGGGGGGGSGGTSALDKLLLGGSVAAGAADALDRRNFRNKAADYSTASYDAKAPLRAKALALLQQDQPRDLSNIFANGGNVYDRQRRAQMIAAPPA